MPWLTQVRNAGRSNSAVASTCKRVEPAPRLGHVLDDEVARVVALEPLGVLERIVDLRERHRSRFEPAVEHLGDAAHHRPAGRIIGIRTHEVVDLRPMQVVDLDAEIALEVGDRSVDIDARVVRDRRCATPGSATPRSGCG